MEKCLVQFGGKGDSLDVNDGDCDGDGDDSSVVEGDGDLSTTKGSLLVGVLGVNEESFFSNLINCTSFSLFIFAIFLFVSSFLSELKFMRSDVLPAIPTVLVIWD